MDLDMFSKQHLASHSRVSCDGISSDMNDMMMGEEKEKESKKKREMDYFVSLR